MVETDHQIEDGITLEPLPATPRARSGCASPSAGEEALLCGDLMHHMIQCRIPDWSTIACADQDAARRTRKAFLDRYAGTGVTVLPSHFPNPTAGRIVPEGAAFAFRYVGE